MLVSHDIAPRRTQIWDPRINGFVERMNGTLLDECLRVKVHTPAQALREALGRKKRPLVVPVAEKEVPKQIG